MAGGDEHTGVLSGAVAVDGRPGDAGDLQGVLGGDIHGAVSYTHLHLRGSGKQHDNSGQSAQRDILPCSLYRYPLFLPVPVSYTHLDVYKRQTAQSAVDIYREIIKDNIDYHILKQDFAIRSGLIQKEQLFTPEQMTEIYR